MILKLIGVLMLFAVGLLVPRRLLQDEHGQLDLGGFGDPVYRHHLAFDQPKGFNP